MTRNEMMRQVAINLEEARHLRGVSIRSLASLIGVDHSHISRVESGRRLPTVYTLVKIAEALRVSPRTLLKGIQ